MEKRNEFQDIVKQKLLEQKNPSKNKRLENLQLAISCGLLKPNKNFTDSIDKIERSILLANSFNDIEWV